MLDNHQSIIPVLEDPNIFKVLDYWVLHQPNAVLYTFLDQHGNIKEQLSYKQFSDSIECIASHLQRQMKKKNGERVLLCYQPGLEFICALFACNKIGCIGVPSPPLLTHNLSAWKFSIEHILEDSMSENIAMCTETKRRLETFSSSSEDPLVKSFLNHFQSIKSLITTALEDN